MLNIKFWVWFRGGDHTSQQSHGQKSLEQRLEQQSPQDLLAALLQTISTKRRTALVLNAAYGYTASEIAAIVGCSEKAARRRLQNGRRELLSKLSVDNYLCTALLEMGHRCSFNPRMKLASAHK